MTITCLSLAPGLCYLSFASYQCILAQHIPSNANVLTLKYTNLHGQYIKHAQYPLVSLLLFCLAFSVTTIHPGWASPPMAPLLELK